MQIQDYDLFLDNDLDESGANGLWDLSGDIGVQIGLNLKDLGILPECFSVYGIDFGQELIYNVLKEMKDNLTQK